MDDVPLFKDVEKPIIGVVHLKPLPGTPLYKGDLGEILERALKDAEALYAGGVDGIIVENYGDKPFTNCFVQERHQLIDFSLGVGDFYHHRHVF